MGNTDKLIQRIKESGDQPIPKWQFTFKRATVWLLFLLSVVAGALAFAVILFSLRETGFWALQHTGHSSLELFLSVLPFLWLGVLLIFLLVAIYSIQFSSKGYKLTTARWVGYSAAISILLGTIFYLGGGGPWIENTFASNISFYESIQEKKMKVWIQPEDGYLAGKMMAVSPNGIELEDFEGNSWTIAYETAFIAPIVQLQAGEEVKLVGEKTGPGTFTADEIRPWQGRAKGRQLGKQPKAGQ
jgi:hypothetical protein